MLDHDRADLVLLRISLNLAVAHSLEQRRLATAIRSHDTVPMATVQAQAGVVQQQQTTVCETKDSVTQLLSIQLTAIVFRLAKPIQVALLKLGADHVRRLLRALGRLTHTAQVWQDIYVVPGLRLHHTLVSEADEQTCHVFKACARVRVTQSREYNTRRNVRLHGFREALQRMFTVRRLSGYGVGAVGIVFRLVCLCKCGAKRLHGTLGMFTHLGEASALFNTFDRREQRWKVHCSSMWVANQLAQIVDDDHRLALDSLTALVQGAAQQGHHHCKCGSCHLGHECNR